MANKLSMDELIAAGNYLDRMEKSYGQLLTDVVFELSKVFREKTETVFFTFLYPPGANPDPKKEVMAECAVSLSETEEAVLSCLSKADDLYREAKQNLLKALNILEGKRRHGK